MPAYGPGESPTWSGEANQDNKWRGTLYITNARLLFEHRTGVVRKKSVLTVEIPLADIAGMSVEIGPWNWIVLVIATKEQKHRFLIREVSPESLIRQIDELKANQQTAARHSTQ